MVVENQIIEGCKKGKRNSYNMLYQRFAPLMLGICYRYSKTKDEAEDVLQEGFIKVFQKINTYDGRGSFEGWIKRIMINTAINNYKANSKHYYHEDVDKDDNLNLKSDDENLPFQLENGIKKETIIKLIQELPSGYQMVFNLYVIDGLTHQEIAEELEFSINTSKSQLSKARKWLRKKLDPIENYYQS